MSRDASEIVASLRRVLNSIVDVTALARLEVERDAARRVTEAALTIKADKLRAVLADKGCREIAIVIEIPDRWSAEPDRWPIVLAGASAHTEDSA